MLQATPHDPATQQIRGGRHHRDRPGRGQPVALDDPLRYATVPELDLMARLAGLRLRDRWGGWRRQPFTAASTTHVSVYERP